MQVHVNILSIYYQLKSIAHTYILWCCITVMLCVVVARHIVAWRHKIVLRHTGDDVVLCGVGLQLVAENFAEARTHHDDFKTPWNHHGAAFCG